ncbi:MAG: hypothetical protein Q9170_002636 [Blastenia crenularia]
MTSNPDQQSPPLTKEQEQIGYYYDVLGRLANNVDNIDWHRARIPGLDPVLAGERDKLSDLVAYYFHSVYGLHLVIDPEGRILVPAHDVLRMPAEQEVDASKTSQGGVQTLDYEEQFDVLDDALFDLSDHFDKVLDWYRKQDHGSSGETQDLAGHLELSEEVDRLPSIARPGEERSHVPEHSMPTTPLDGEADTFETSAGDLQPFDNHEDNHHNEDNGREEDVESYGLEPADELEKAGFYRLLSRVKPEEPIYLGEDAEGRLKFAMNLSNHRAVTQNNQYPLAERYLAALALTEVCCGERRGKASGSLRPAGSYNRG